MLLSIIIPLYNAEHYIVRCLESCYMQGLAESAFEIIVINDGSTDRSLEVVNGYLKSKTNIRLYTQKNLGQGAARNFGLKQALGKYILFLDSDDFLLSNTVSRILNVAENTSCEVVNFLMEVELPTGNVKESYLYYYDFKKIYSGEELLLQNNVNIGSACSSLYKKDFILQNGIFFPTDMKHEDVFFSYQVYTFASKVSFSNIHAYYYCWNTASTDRSVDPQKLRILQMSEISQAYYLNKLSSDQRVKKEISNYLKKASNSTLISLLLSIFKKDSVLSKKDFKKECIHRGLYPLKGRTLSWKTTSILFIFKIILAFS